MGIFGRVLAAEERNADDERLWSPGLLGATALSGVTVSPDSALKVSAVWGCVRLISESMATLPLFVYRKRADGGRERADEHPLAWLLRHEPNNYQTAFEFVEMLTAHALLRGKGVAEIVPGARGAVDQLVPLHPDVVTVEQLANRRLRFRVNDGTGERVLNDDQVFYLRGLSLDGVNPLSVIEYARESIGLAMAAEQYGARFFSQSAMPPVVLEHPAKLSKEAQARLKENWQDMYGGLRNAHRPGVLEEGMKATVLGLKPEDAQFLQTREFGVVDIARWFRVPLHMIQETSKSTSWGSGIEQLSLAFVQFTLLPWARRWEQAISRDLIIASDRYYAAFNVNALARGDLKSRMESYQIGIMNGVYCPDDVRSLEDLNPLPDGQGQQFWMPANLTPVERALEEPEPAPPPAPTQPPTDDGEDGDASRTGVRRSEGHYRGLLEEAAGRVLRKELAALGKAWKRCGEQIGPAWEAEVRAFYADHAAFVAQVMRMPMDEAQGYAQTQAQAALLFGPVGVGKDAECCVELLCEMATGVGDV